jgi:chaperonin cofactor prefoldin
MREQLRDSSESPSAKYEQLLKRGVELQKKYESLGAKINKAYDRGDDDAAEELSEESSQLKDEFDALLGERAKLLRQVENLETVEDAYPRVRTATEEDRKKIDYAEVIRAFTAGQMSVEDLRNIPSPQAGNVELTDEEFDDFCRARAQLARKLGYEVEGDNDASGNWFSIKRNGVEFSIKHFATPSDFGIAGFSRISKFGVSSDVKGGDMNYDRGWDTACTSAEVQKEIDRVVAIFG